MPRKSAKRSTSAKINARNSSTNKEDTSESDSSGDEYDFLSKPGKVSSSSIASSSTVPGSQNGSFSPQTPSTRAQNTRTPGNRTPTTRTPSTSRQSQFKRPADRVDINISSSRKQPRKQTKPKKKRKNLIFREIQRLRMTTDTIIPLAPFHRLVREIIFQNKPGDEWRVTKLALDAMQESTEQYLTQIFEDSSMCTTHRQRVTLSVQDMRLVRFLRGPSDPSYL